MAGAIAKITDKYIYSRLARLGEQHPRLAKAVKYAVGIAAGGTGASLAVYDPTTLAASIPALLWLSSLPGRVELSQHRDAYVELSRLRDELIVKRTKAESILSAGQLAVVQQRKWEVRKLTVFDTEERKEIVQQYILADKIGEGGQAVVHRALNLSKLRLEVIKITHGELSSDKVFKARFMRETELLQMELYGHNNIVKVYASGEMVDPAEADCGSLFYTMENIEGTSLANMLGINGRMSMLKASRMMIKIASALRDVHNKGIVHRDIKPDNILIDNSGEVKVIDFGLAGGNLVARGLTRMGQIMGTPEYMSLEQLNGAYDPQKADRVDARSDLYAEGAMLFEMLTGKPPFPARAKENVISYLFRMRELLEKGVQPDIEREFSFVDHEKLAGVIGMMKNIFGNTLVPKERRYKHDNQFIEDLQVLEQVLTRCGVD